MVFSQLAGDSESLAKGLPVERFLGKPSSVLSMTGAKKFANAPRKQQGREVTNSQNGRPLWIPLVLLSTNKLIL